MTFRELTFLIVLKPHGEVTIFTLLKASLGDTSALQVNFFLLPALFQSGHLCANGFAGTIGARCHCPAQSDPS